MYPVQGAAVVNTAGGSWTPGKEGRRRSPQPLPWVRLPWVSFLGPANNFINSVLDPCLPSDPEDFVLETK